MKTATPDGDRCTWTRTPSNFHSAAAAVPIRAMASAESAAVCASIGRSGMPGVSRGNGPDLRGLRRYGARHGRQVARHEDRPAQVGHGDPAARATASTITPPRAPWRSSPDMSPRRKRASGSVNRANSPESSVRRTSCEPGPEAARMRSSVAWVSRRPTVGGAGVGGGAPHRRPPPHPTTRPAPRPRGRRRRWALGGGEGQQAGGEQLDLGETARGGGHRRRRRCDLRQAP